MMFPPYANNIPTAGSSEIATIHNCYKAFIASLDWLQPTIELDEAQKRLRASVTNMEDLPVYQSKADEVALALGELFMSRVRKLYRH